MSTAVLVIIEWHLFIFIGIKYFAIASTKTQLLTSHNQKNQQTRDKKVDLAQGVQIVSFGILAVMMIAAAIGVVVFDNIVYSAFLLGGVFVSISGLYLLLNADFVAAAQLLVYVGAINVLILFAIMLVNKREDFVPLPSAGLRKVLTALVSIGLFGLLSTMVLATPWGSTSAIPVSNSIIAIGEHFFSDYLLPFELASILLLIAMVGAIILARREYLPEPTSLTDTKATVLTLPEKPREMVSAGSDKD